MNGMPKVQVVPERVTVRPGEGTDVEVTIFSSQAYLSIGARPSTSREISQNITPQRNAMPDQIQKVNG